MSLVDSPIPSVNQAPTTFPKLSEVPDKVLSLFPKNPLASMVSGEMLQVILFAAVLGFALISIPVKQAQPLFDLLGALQEVSIRVVSWAMLLAPIAVFGLITKLVANLGLDVLTGMLMYVITVILGLLSLVVVYALVIKLTCKYSVKHFFIEIKELLLLAFSTSSSAAVMPLTLQFTENELKVRGSIARFLIPLGATINMAGTALYQGVATVFLAQVFQVDLSFTSYAFIITMAVAASIGSPATPGAGIVILSMVLEGVGIPSAGIALLLGVDRILDMCRTAVNVLGDVVACCLVERLLPIEKDKTINLSLDNNSTQ
jgi:Na+/H+-dicarboxylate symporter